MTTTPAPPRALGARVARWATLLLLAGLTLFGALASVAFVSTGPGPTWLRAWGWAGLLVALVQGWLMLRALADPVKVGYLVCLLSLLFPLGVVGPLLAWLVVLVIAPREAERRAAGVDEPETSDIAVMGVCAAVVTALSVWRDGRVREVEHSLVKSLTHGDASADLTGLVSDPMPWTYTLAMTAGLLIVVGIIGEMMHARRRERRAQAQAREAVDARDGAQTALGRQVERERIAREVHDSLGHRLSLLSVHAGALELQAERADPALAQSAAVVRESAQQSMRDLRSLVTLLRENPDGEHSPALADLPAMVDEIIAAGQPIASSVFITDPERADEALSRAVYRIVQELLTNARRHAPGQVARLVVRGSPTDGVLVEASNRLVAEASGQPGHGLAGLRERVELLGGRTDIAVVDGQFRVQAWMPWRETV